MRQFIRHPSDIPIELEVSPEESGEIEILQDVSLGGLSFHCTHEVEIGSRVFIRVPLLGPECQARGRVVWCHRNRDLYHVGVEFLSQEEAYRARMVEQICHIEHYKREVLNTEGRQLSSEEAAQEWVNKYAHVFPAVGKPLIRA